MANDDLAGFGSSDALPRWFAAGRDASLAFIERFHAKPPPATMFHYTSSAALISIVRSNEMWLSDATFLNDRVEVEHGRQVARQRLEEASLWDGGAEVQAMVVAALKLLETKPNPAVYVACFSWEADDLAQWRGYGQGEAPVAIELEHSPFMFGYTSEGLFQEVRYDLEEQSWTFDQVIRAYWDAYSEDVRDPRPSRRHKPLPREEERNICAGKLYHDFWRYIIACKNPAFRSEREVRFTYTAHDFGDIRDWHPEHPAPSFRESDGRVVPYLTSRNLDFQNMERIQKVPLLPIRSVRIGPTDDQTLIARGVRRLLDVNGHASAEVLLSGSPYRSP